MLSTCSVTVIGTAGLSDFCGTDPVIATQMMQGFVMWSQAPLRRGLASGGDCVSPLSVRVKGTRGAQDGVNRSDRQDIPPSSFAHSLLPMVTTG